MITFVVCTVKLHKNCMQCTPYAYYPDLHNRVKVISRLWISKFVIACVQWGHLLYINSWMKLGLVFGQVYVSLHVYESIILLLYHYIESEGYMNLKFQTLLSLTCKHVVIYIYCIILFYKFTTFFFAVILYKCWLLFTK